MSIATVDMKHGMQVTLDGDTTPWDVLDRHPLNRTWWLHRWNDGVWETTYAHETALTAADETALEPPVTETAKWTAAPFNAAGKDGVTIRKTGYVFGKWAATKQETPWKYWSLTHLPTGLSIGNRDTLPLARATLTALQAEEFPALDSSPFGVSPTGDSTRQDLARLRSLLEVS